jgi:cytochrome P450
MEYGDVVRLRWGWVPVYLLSRPQHVQHVLQINSRNYRKGIGYARMRPLVGDSILTSEGDSWLRQRRIVQPAFHHRRIAGFVSIIVRATQRLLDRWDSLPNRFVDVAAEMVDLSNQIIGEIVFGEDYIASSAPLKPALDHAIELGDRIAAANTQGLLSLLSGLGVLPGGQSQAIRREIAQIQAEIHRVIARRRASPQGDDVLAMLLEAGDDQAQSYLNTQQVRDEALTIYLAGHRTTGVALSWAWHLLAQHRAVEACLHAELEQALGNTQPDITTLARLPYTRMVLDESLRLYPPIWMTLRTAVADDVVGGWRIPAGAGVIVSPYVTQHHPAFWQAPEIFDPQRFAAERTQSYTPYSYFPFGGGSRQCIGMSLALTEAQLVLALIAQRYRLAEMPGQVVSMEPTLVLRPQGGLPMMAMKRGRVSGAASAHYVERDQVGLPHA